jgi:hypothetical protein
MVSLISTKTATRKQCPRPHVHNVNRLLKPCKRAEEDRQTVKAGLLTHRMSLNVSVNQLSRPRVNGQGTGTEDHPICNDGLGVDAHSGRRSFLSKDGDFGGHRQLMVNPKLRSYVYV